MSSYCDTGCLTLLKQHIPRREQKRDKKSKGYLSRVEEQQLGKRIQKGDEEALNDLVLANMSLVISLAKKYSSLGLNLEDLVSEGALSLVMAAKKFDPDRGNRFSTYAVWSIRRAMIKAIVEQRGVVNLPYHKSSLLFRINRIKQKLSQEHSAPVSLDMVARESNVPLKQVENISMAAGHYTSFDKILDTENEDDLYAVCEQVQDCTPFEKAQLVEDTTLILRIIKALPEPERKILTMYYGLDGNCEMTFVEIGRRLGLSRQRVQQIEKRGMTMLQEKLGLNN
jgi:RNA polymerase primary sigma factor